MGFFRIFMDFCEILNAFSFIFYIYFYKFLSIVWCSIGVLSLTFSCYKMHCVPNLLIFQFFCLSFSYFCSPSQFGTIARYLELLGKWDWHGWFWLELWEKKFSFNCIFLIISTISRVKDSKEKMCNLLYRLCSQIFLHHFYLQTNRQ